MHLDSTVCTLSLDSVQFGQNSSNIHMTVSQEMTETKQQQLRVRMLTIPLVCCKCMHCLEFTTCSIINIGEIITETLLC